METCHYVTKPGMTLTSCCCKALLHRSATMETCHYVTKTDRWHWPLVVVWLCFTDQQWWKPVIMSLRLTDDTDLLLLYGFASQISNDGNLTLCH